MAFVDYTSDDKTHVPAFISLTKSKTMNLSKGFITKHNLIESPYKWARLAYDPPGRLVRIRLLKNEEKDCFSVTYDSRNEGASIACGMFTSYFGIDLSKYSGQYSYNEKSAKGEKIFVFKLKEA